MNTKKQQQSSSYKYKQFIHTIHAIDIYIQIFTLSNNYQYEKVYKKQSASYKQCAFGAPKIKL